MCFIRFIKSQYYGDVLHVFLCCASVDVDYNEYVQNPVLMIYRQDFVHYSRDEKCLYDSTYQKKEIDTYNYLLDRLFHKKVKAHG